MIFNLNYIKIDVPSVCYHTLLGLLKMKDNDILRSIFKF